MGPLIYVRVKNAEEKGEKENTQLRQEVFMF